MSVSGSPEEALEDDDAWVYTTEKAGPTCPFGHPWDANERLLRAEEALQDIQFNAKAWHGPEPDMGHVRALAVIATWSADALAGTYVPLSDRGAYFAREGQPQQQEQSETDSGVSAADVVPLSGEGLAG